MDKEIEVLVEAAEQLERLKETLKAQSDAGARVRTFTEILEKVTAEISRVPAGLSAVKENLQGFKDATTQLRELVETFRDAIGEAVALFAAEVRRSRDAQTQTDLAIAALRGELLTRLDRVQAGVEAGARLAEASTGATASAFQQTTAAVRAAGERQAEVLQRVGGLLAKLGDQDVAGLRADVLKLSQQIAEQGKALKVIASKKGFSF